MKRYRDILVRLSAVAALSIGAPGYSAALVQKPVSANVQKPKTDVSARRTAIKVPEPSSVLLFGGAILLLLIARQFGRARIKPQPEEKWAQFEIWKD